MYEQVLTCGEIIRLGRIFADLGIVKIRVTGGEPLVRKDVPHLIRELKKISGIENVSMTTNGCYLMRYADELAEAGLDRVNISLDTVDRDTYRLITGYDGLDEVRQGIRRMADRGIRVKINCVPIRGLNEKDVCAVAGLACEGKTDVRFIELMQIGIGAYYRGLAGRRPLPP